jgi:hypothetical protein
MRFKEKAADIFYAVLNFTTWILFAIMLAILIVIISKTSVDVADGVRILFT